MFSIFHNIVWMCLKTFGSPYYPISVLNSCLITFGSILSTFFICLKIFIVFWRLLDLFERVSWLLMDVFKSSGSFWRNLAMFDELPRSITRFGDAWTVARRRLASFVDVSLGFYDTAVPGRWFATDFHDVPWRLTRMTADWRRSERSSITMFYGANSRSCCGRRKSRRDL